MPLLTAYVDALIPRRVKISGGMEGGKAIFDTITKNRLRAITSVKSSSWNRDILAPFESPVSLRRSLKSMLPLAM
jgi:hypothetical protein